MSAEADTTRAPRLAPAVAAHHHLLLLAGDVEPDELETLVLSLVVGARWTTPPSATLPGVLDLLPDADRHSRATLTGPWAADAARDALGLPEWAETVVVVDVDPERSAPAPALAGGYGDLLDAFGLTHPEGLERQVLDVVHACARRLAGAVRTSTGVLLEPHPDSAVDLVVHAPTWLDPEALAHVLEPALPGLELMPGADAAAAEGHHLDGYGASWTDVRTSNDGEDDGAAHLAIDVEAAEVLPPALRTAAWTSGGVLSYAVRWAEHDRTPTARAGLRRRAGIRARIGRAALALHEAVGGAILDEDGFLVAPEQLAQELANDPRTPATYGSVTRRSCE
ncbi:hypothetical protein [Litorihabitans aurantiacus]|uniref:Uncharacterized protein n=1 Tax=Litorihabitans aurantiacus TaxID=1930061 RepID=A0AA38CW74_9MICO|nr:hypothetical protein [Litorihabitans aurantiacus]GMA32742.1 hypothetical protein GCM10025875_27340 [Litorihabitans aurantiacus]